MSWTKRTIALTGFMGSGKTTTGRYLAQMTGRPFLDSDHEIEKTTGLSISDMFARYGESGFRRIEQEVLACLLKQPAHVLATGGGTYLDQASRDMLRVNAVTVWLDTDLEVVWQRVAGRTHRPLLQAPNPKMVLSDLYKTRKPVYALADIHVPNANESHMALAVRILKRLQNPNGYDNG